MLCPQAGPTAQQLQVAAKQQLTGLTSARSTAPHFTLAMCPLRYILLGISLILVLVGVTASSGSAEESSAHRHSASHSKQDMTWREKLVSIFHWIWAAMSGQHLWQWWVQSRSTPAVLSCPLASAPPESPTATSSSDPCYRRAAVNQE